jgi:hypothetical protein
LEIVAKKRNEAEQRDLPVESRWGAHIWTAEDEGIVRNGIDRRNRWIDGWIENWQLAIGNWQLAIGNWRVSIERHIRCLVVASPLPAREMFCHCTV